MCHWKCNNQNNFFSYSLSQLNFLFLYLNWLTKAIKSNNRRKIAILIILIVIQLCNMKHIQSYVCRKNNSVWELIKMKIQLYFQMSKKKIKIFFIVNIVTTYSSVSFNPLTPTSDQDRISPYNINTISSRQVMRIKKY